MSATVVGIEFLPPEMDTPTRPSNQSTPSTSRASQGSLTAFPTRTENAEKKDVRDAGFVWARTVDDPWEPCFLTFDGGGVYSLSSLLILRALMHEIHLWECRLADDDDYILRQKLGKADHEPLDSSRQSHVPAEKDLLPCHYFDFFFGTSSGGLIAILLGRLRMPVEEAISAFLKIHQAMFSVKRWNSLLFARYDHRPMEETIDNIVTRGTFAVGSKMFSLYPPNHGPFVPENPRKAQVCCLTTPHDGSLIEPTLLRTYPLEYPTETPNWVTRYPEGAEYANITWVARAATAFSNFFHPAVATHENVSTKYADGATRENNPSGCALAEFHALYGGLGVPALMLSVGATTPTLLTEALRRSTGHFFRALQSFEKYPGLQNVLPKYTEGEKQHTAMRQYSRGENTWYRRLNPKDALPVLRLTDKSATTYSSIVTATSQYLNTSKPWDSKYIPPQTVLRQMAEKLARLRRAREAQGGPRWATFVV